METVSDCFRGGVYGGHLVFDVQSGYRYLLTLFDYLTNTEFRGDGHCIALGLNAFPEVLTRWYGDQFPESSFQKHSNDMTFQAFGRSLLFAGVIQLEHIGSPYSFL